MLVDFQNKKHRAETALLPCRSDTEEKTGFRILQNPQQPLPGGDPAERAVPFANPPALESNRDIRGEPTTEIQS